MRLLARLQTGRISAVICLLVAVVTTGALFALLPQATGDSFPTSGLPSSAESSRVDALLQQFLDADQTAGLAEHVESMTPEDRAVVQTFLDAVADIYRAASDPPEPD